VCLKVSLLKAVEVTEAKLEREEIGMFTRLNGFVSCYSKNAKIFLPGKWM